VEIARPASLWKQLPDDRRVAAARAFWADTSSAEFHQEAVGLVARQMNFRPKSVVSLPLDRKARSLASIRSLSERVALRALVSYHLEHQRAMMASFLDELQIAHDNGLITAEEVQPPGRDRLQAAADRIAGLHPAEEVRLYLWTLLAQDPETWAALEDVSVGEGTGSSGA
jgi:hypothetical protein